MAEVHNIVPFPSPDAPLWIERYQQARLTALSDGTRQVYISILQHFFRWLAGGKKKREAIEVGALTPAMLERYFIALEREGYSMSHRKRAKSVLTHFCQWLVDEQELLASNPLRGFVLPSTSNPSSAHVSLRGLSPAQRVILLRLAEQDDARGQAIFALSYWSGCRVSEITHLLFAHTHVGPRGGWLHLEKTDGFARDIDLLNETRRSLLAYLHERGRDETSPYVFLSQRSARLSEAGLHTWFRDLKSRAIPEERTHIQMVRFQDLRDDFAYRAHEAGWTEEEIAYYLGYFTADGALSLRSTVRFTQLTRAHLKGKLVTLQR
jgi:site-specific recombinase XerD